MFKDLQTDVKIESAYCDCEINVGLGLVEIAWNYSQNVIVREIHSRIGFG